MGLIYVNPEGPDGNPDPLKAAVDIRETFKRMAMNDEETVALIAGGHSFGKTHGAGPATNVGADPEDAGFDEQGLGWKSKFRSGVGGDAITSGLEVTWTTTPTKWSNGFFENLFGYEWELTKSPAGCAAVGGQGRAGDDPESGRSVEEAVADDVDDRPRAAVGSGVREDFAAVHGAPGAARRCVRAGVVQADASRHGSAGAVSRAGGAEGGADLAGPDPGGESSAGGCEGRRGVEGEGALGGAERGGAGVDGVGECVDVPRFGQARRGERGAGSARAAEGLGSESAGAAGEGAQGARGDSGEFNKAAAGGKKVSLADLIVLAGCAGVEQAAKNAGARVTVPFTPGRMDASQEQTDVESFEVLEPIADGFRNYLKGRYTIPAETLLIDKAQLLTLTAPEMTVLVGGMRVLGTNAGGDEAWRVHQAGRRRSRTTSS